MKWLRRNGFLLVCIFQYIRCITNVTEDPLGISHFSIINASDSTITVHVKETGNWGTVLDDSVFHLVPLDTQFLCKRNCFGPPNPSEVFDSLHIFGSNDTVLHSVLVDTRNDTLWIKHIPNSGYPPEYFWYYTWSPGQK